MADDILRLGVHGASGKMGLAVIRQIFRCFYQNGGGVPKPQLAAAIGHRNSSLLGTDIRNNVIPATIKAADDAWLAGRKFNLLD